MPDELSVPALKEQPSSWKKQFSAAETSAEVWKKSAVLRAAWLFLNIEFVLPGSDLDL